MSRATRAYGRPGTAVIPDGWAASHAPVAEGLMLEATVSLRAPGTTNVWDDDAGTTVPTPRDPFATNVPARILALTEVRVPPADAVDAQVRVIGYRVSVPIGDGSDTALTPGVIVDVLTCTGDALLIGRQLEVSDVVRGTHLFERDLICTLND